MKENENQDKKSKKNDRREFLKKAAIGTIGASALIAGLGTSEKAFARLLSIKTNAHIDEYFQRVRNSKLSSFADSNIVKSIDNLVQAASENDVIVNNANTLLRHFADRVVRPSREPKTVLGLAKSASDLLTSGYLAALPAFSSAPLTARDFNSLLSDVDTLIGRLEPDFLSRALPQLQDEMSRDAELNNSINRATENMNSAFGRLAPPIEVGVGVEVSPWVAVAAVVVIVVLIIVLK
ncbi:MAG TPA: hypothetical protein PKY59_19025 [Pyrinomonadaceae bacterium]|nr:hypothetical protein [Pyrinomonadaceae bacterium]